MFFYPVRKLRLIKAIKHFITIEAQSSYKYYLILKLTCI